MQLRPSINLTMPPLETIITNLLMSNQNSVLLNTVFGLLLRVLLVVVPDKMVIHLIFNGGDVNRYIQI